MTSSEEEELFDWAGLAGGAAVCGGGNVLIAERRLTGLSLLTRR